LHFLRSSTPFPAGQIFSTPLNAKSRFNLQPLNAEATEPTVNTTADGFSLTVAAAHAVNIKEFLPGDMYAYEDEGSRGKFNVGRNDWSRFSELLCL
ncbi:hypothetical protein, partial [Pseudomonas helleri]|uniref:hypothetical protein n=1 Tax=Pseudomonas helleri TaxID=1608996 RepID=UPI001E610C5E